MKISVIVPVYNSEQYVGRCIESVIAQTFSDWEMILIDDGSNDNSLSVLRNYEAKDSRITVISQKNSGPGLARNAGIIRAKGEYIVFIDSDDVIANNYFTLLSNKNEDVIFINVDQVNEKMEVLSREYLSSYSNISKNEFIKKQMTGCINWGGVRKVVKKSILIDNNILFSEHKIGEEAIYSFLVLHYANTFSFIDSPVYKYINRPGSQSSLKMDDPWGPVAIALRNKVKSIGVYDEYASTLNAFIKVAMIVALDKMAINHSYREYRTLALETIKKYKRQIDLENSTDIKSLNYKAKLMLPLLNPILYHFAYFISVFRKLIRKKNDYT